jgi:hypothetical protein
VGLWQSPEGLGYKPFHVYNKNLLNRLTTHATYGTRILRRVTWPQQAARSVGPLILMHPSALVTSRGIQPIFERVLPDEIPLCRYARQTWKKRNYAQSHRRILLFSKIRKNIKREKLLQIMSFQCQALGPYYLGQTAYFAIQYSLHHKQ